MVFRLERVIKCDNEGVITRRENFLLGQRSLDFVPLNHFFLAENFTIVRNSRSTGDTQHTFHSI